MLQADMILGIGNDIMDVRRLEKAYERFGQRFLDRIFTAGEQAKANRREKAGRNVMLGTYAKRFAAKEACAKALGTGLREGVFWRDMEVVNLPSGQPTLELKGGAMRRLQQITPPGNVAAVHLTMTDEYPYAEAQVVITAIRGVTG